MKITDELSLEITQTATAFFHTFFRTEDGKYCGKFEIVCPDRMDEKEIEQIIPIAEAQLNRKA